MEPKPQNPFAFPIVETKDAVGLEPGMTLRDYFANSVMNSILSNQELLNAVLQAGGLRAKSNDAIAKESYSMADAMLKAREL